MLGNVPAGDILIQIGRIAAVGASLQAEGDALIDGLDPQEVNKWPYPVAYGILRKPPTPAAK